METETIKKITDPEIISGYFDSLFMNRDVFLKTDTVDLKISVIRHTGARICLDIPVDDFTGDNITIFSRNNDEIIYSDIVFSGMEGGRYLFDARSMELVKIIRKEERKRVEAVRGKKTVISRIVTKNGMIGSLRQKKTRVEWARKQIASKILPRYDHVKVYFLGDQGADARMDWLLGKGEALFIPQLNPDIAYDDPDVAVFIRDICLRDNHLKNRNYSSEITVPLLYRMMMPFAYIQVNHAGILGESHLEEVKELAESYSMSLSGDDQLFEPSADTMMISDLSMNGVGMICREESLVADFEETHPVIFTAYMPDNRSVDILCRIANITLNNNWYRIGCSIEKIGKEGEEAYREFVSGL